MFTIFLTKIYIFIFIPAEFQVFVPIFLARHDIFEYQYIKYIFNILNIYYIDILNIYLPLYFMCMS